MIVKCVFKINEEEWVGPARPLWKLIYPLIKSPVESLPQDTQEEESPANGEDL